MTISRLNINGQSYRQQDFLDLVLALQNEKNNTVKVTYRVGRSLDLKNKTVYQRNIHNNQWIMTMNKGKRCDQPIRVVKENKQFIIQYV